MSTSRTTNPLTVTAPEGLPFIDFEREFDHPVEKVFRAHQDSDLFRRWIGAGSDNVDLPIHEFRTGGRYRFVQQGEDGEAYAFNGVYHVVRENEFAIQTFEFEGFPDVVAIESITFTDLGGGRARLSIHSVYPTVEARDGMVASGMETGVTEGYDRLEKLATGL